MAELHLGLDLHKYIGDVNNTHNVFYLLMMGKIDEKPCLIKVVLTFSWQNIETF